MKTRVDWSASAICGSCVKRLRDLPGETPVKVRARSASTGRLSGVKGGRRNLADLTGTNDLDVMTCEEKTNLGVICYENPAR